MVQRRRTSLKSGQRKKDRESEQATIPLIFKKNDERETEQAASFPSRTVDANVHYIF